LEDLKQVAALALVKAASNYDPARGNEFLSYAIPTIVGELKRHFRDTGWDVRVPRQLQERGLNINRAVADLTQQFGHAPNVTQLAKHLDLGTEEVLQGFEAARAYSAVSLQTPASDGEGGIELGELCGEDDPAFSCIDDLLSLQPALRCLSSREQHVIALRFYGNMTQSRIAVRLGVSQMHVSRLLSQALTRLRSQLSDEAATDTHDCSDPHSGRLRRGPHKASRRSPNRI
jgi:RNA polymerase sigma-B factor